MKKRKRKRRITHRTQKATNFVYITNSFFPFFILKLCHANAISRCFCSEVEPPLTDAFLVQPRSNGPSHINVLCDWSRKLETTSTNQMLLGHSFSRAWSQFYVLALSSDGFHYYVHLFLILRFSSFGFSFARISRKELHPTFYKKLTLKWPFPQLLVFDNYKAVTKVCDSQTAGNRVSDITYCDGYQP